MPRFRLAALIGAILLPATALAQDGPRGPLGYQLPVGVAHMPDADLADGGAVSVTRWLIEPGARYTGTGWGAVGLGIGYGEVAFDFSDDATLGGGDPWGTVRDLTIALPVNIRAGDRAEVFLIPSLRYNAELGASLSDGATYGLLGGAIWEFGDRLSIGPGIGWFSALEEADTIIPILLIDWQIAERWSLTTGELFGATRGPGLSLNWQAARDWQIGLTARYESVQFRLDDDGPAPGGVGEDESVPIVLGARWSPNPGFRLGAFAGVQTGGTLRLYDRDGREVAEQGYDTAPLIGLTARLRF